MEIDIEYKIAAMSHSEMAVALQRFSYLIKVMANQISDENLKSYVKEASYQCDLANWKIKESVDMQITKVIDSL